MTPARSLFIAVVAVALLLGGRPMAGNAQFPRGLLSGETRAHYCTIETRPLVFGSYDPLDDSPLHATGQIIYVCGGGNEPDVRGPKNIRIEMARGFSNDYGRRAMAGPDGGNLFYNIYLDATHNTIWGDGSSNTGYYFDAHPPNKTPVTVPAFGRIPPRQDVDAGQYVDQPAVRILF